jgi:hypothetical protein
MQTLDMRGQKFTAQEIVEHLQNLSAKCRSRPDAAISLHYDDFFNSPFIMKCADEMLISIAMQNPPSQLEVLGLYCLLTMYPNIPAPVEEE